MQRLVLPVLHIAHIRREDIGKDEVGRVQDLPPGAEILGEKDLALLSGRSLLVGEEPGILLQKDGGVCQAEAVDALLDVAHRENILPIPGHCPENGVLHFVGVLVLIHQDLLIPLGHLPPQLRGGAVLPHQQPQRQMLLVGEVRRVEPKLFCLISPGKLACQPQQSFHSGRHGPQVLHGLFPAYVQQLGKLFVLGLAGLPHFFECHDLRLVLAALGSGQAGKCNGIRRPAGLLPAAARCQCVKCLRAGLEFFSVSSRQRLVPCCTGGTSPQQLCPVGCLSPDICQQCGGVRGIVKTAVQRGPGCLVFLKPLLRIGMALELFMDLQYQSFQGPVVPPGAQCVRQRRACLVQGIVKSFQRPLQHPLAHQRGITLVQHPEIRRQCVTLVAFGQQVCVFPQQRRAEGVHGLDIRPVYPQQLPAKVGVARVCRQTAIQLRGDLTPQLRGGGFGIGDDEEIIHAAPVSGHIQEKTVHQDLGFAGTGGSGHQQAAAPVVHHRLLGSSQLNFRHGSQPPFLFVFQPGPEFLWLHRQDIVQMIAVPAVLEMAGLGPVAVLAEAVLLAFAAWIGVDIAVPDLPGNLMQQLFDIPPQLAQLSGRGNAAGDIAVPAHPQRQEFWLGQRRVLHGLQDGWVGEQQSGAAQLLGCLLSQLFRGNVALGSQDIVSCR